MIDLVQALAAHQTGEVSQPELWRALVTFDRWLVPLTPDRRQNVFDPLRVEHVAIDGSSPTPQLHLFTSAAAVEHFELCPFGTSGQSYGDAEGEELFALDLSSIASIEVDPGSSRSLSIPAEAFAALGELAEAAGVESAWGRIARGDELPDDLARVVEYAGYYLVALALPEGYHSIHVPHDGGGNFIPLFTHADAWERGIADFEANFGDAPMKTIRASGTQLFPRFANESVTGIVFNYLGPPPPIAFQLGIMELLTAEIERLERKRAID